MGPLNNLPPGLSAKDPYFEAPDIEEEEDINYCLRKHNEFIFKIAGKEVNQDDPHD